jgi:hypothetical protein
MTPIEPINSDKSIEEEDGTHRAVMVTLDPDVAVVFPDSQSVNEALRLLIKVAKAVQNLPKENLVSTKNEF